MTALQTKWAQMSWYRRILLVGMAAEILVFFPCHIGHSKPAPAWNTRTPALSQHPG